jgi:hypothetical protein
VKYKGDPMSILLAARLGREIQRSVLESRLMNAKTIETMV